MITKKNLCPITRHYISTLPDFYALPSKQRSSLVFSSVDYLFRFKGSIELRREISSLGYDKAKVLESQASISQKGGLTKDLKLYLLRKSVGEPVKKIVEYDFIYRGLSKEKLLKIGKLAKASPTLSKDQLDALLVKCIDNSKDYARKFITKKMTFLIKAGVMSHTEIYSHLILESLQRLLFMFPYYKSELHAENILKNSIKNLGKNLIDFHTRKKRNAYLDSNTYAVTSFDLVSSADDELYDATDSILHTNGLASKLGDDPLEIDLKKLTDRYAGSPKAKLIHLLKGEYDKGFTDYLHSKSVISDKTTNDIYFEKERNSKYISNAISFVGMSQAKGEKFIRKLQKVLTPYS